MKKQTLTIAAITLAGATGSAQFDVPRGQNVEPLAANCGAGPFGQVSKAAYYNHLCKTMTDAEKCLARIKGHLYLASAGEDSTTDQYLFRPARGSEADVMAYCLDHLRSQLLPATPNQGE